MSISILIIICLMAFIFYLLGNQDTSRTQNCFYDTVFEPCTVSCGEGTQIKKLVLNKNSPSTCKSLTDEETVICSCFIVLF